ncbi:hypothetical protein Goshw_009116 [Gossypium schwendimanii]|uniref:D-isomer specific 2-hydroxyacid dehydrogenase NAD-binding domain-containing protein n=1 Tax=Gossypium schwendimanii TaxID=34291 RepID=A0A7J9LW96_GOSSC|nr:hypothetical protein [Gossypium schwendimanii]
MERGLGLWGLGELVPKLHKGWYHLVAALLTAREGRRQPSHTFTIPPSMSLRRSIGRRGLIDEKELVKFLVQGRVGGADLDVYEDEPHVPPELFAMDNIVLAPHAAVYSPESFEALQELVIGNLKALFSDQPLISPAQLE